MSQHLAEAELNDYLDGSLPGTERAALEEHLAACALCQAEAAAQRQLLDRLHALPRSIDPPAELRSATLRVTRRTLPGQGLARWRALRPVALPLAAAALVLVFATALVTRWLVQERPAARAVVAASRGRAPVAPPMAGREAPARAGGVAPAAGRSGTPVGPAVAAAPADSATAATRAPVMSASFVRDERRYAAEIGQLQRQLAEQRERLSPATVAILERNLRVIDSALAESRAALKSDPANRALGRLVLSAYEQKLELLKRATSFAS